MLQKIITNYFYALCFVLTLLSCNQQEKKDESSATVDTTAAETTAAAVTAPAAETIDAVKAAPALYKIAKDTMGIRVLDISYNSGDSSALHSHPDNVLYVVNGGKTEFTEKDGTKHTNDLKSGTIMIQSGGTHGVKNVGTAAVKAILVEVNRPDRAGAARDAALDPTKVSPAIYKTTADSLNIRVLVATAKPGATTALHFHPDNAIYVIEGGTTEMTGKDGSKQKVELPKGSVLVMPAGEHIVKNTGKNTLKVLVVEINRPVQ